MISLLVTSVMIKLALVWRRRKQEEATYEPVNAAIKEQELQPLSETSNAWASSSLIESLYGLSLFIYIYIFDRKKMKPQNTGNKIPQIKDTFDFK